MCKIDPTIKNWFEEVNNMGQNIAYHARDDYDTFLEKCLEPYGINKENAHRYADRVRIEEEGPNIEGFETVSYQRFYIDGKYEFTAVFKQKPVNESGFITGTIVTYEKIVELDRVPKEKSMTYKEAINILETVRGMTGDGDEDVAFDKAIAALAFVDGLDSISKGSISIEDFMKRNYSGLFDKED